MSSKSPGGSSSLLPLRLKHISLVWTSSSSPPPFHHSTPLHYQHHYHHTNISVVVIEDQASRMPDGPSYAGFFGLRLAPAATQETRIWKASRLKREAMALQSATCTKKGLTSCNGGVPEKSKKTHSYCRKVILVATSTDHAQSFQSRQQLIWHSAACPALLTGPMVK